MGFKGRVCVGPPRGTLGEIVEKDSKQPNQCRAMRMHLSTITQDGVGPVQYPETGMVQSHAPAWPCQQPRKLSTMKAINSHHTHTHIHNSFPPPHKPQSDVSAPPTASTTWRPPRQCQ